MADDNSGAMEEQEINENQELSGGNDTMMDVAEAWDKHMTPEKEDKAEEPEVETVEEEQEPEEPEKAEESGDVEPDPEQEQEEEQEEQEAAGEVEPEPEKQTEQENNAPTSWNKEERKLWNDISDEARKVIERRENDFLKGTELYREKAKDSDAWTQSIKPFERNLKQVGIDPKAAVQGLLNTENVLRNGTQLQKAATIKNLIQQYGIDMERVAQPPSEADQHVLQYENQLSSYNNELRKTQQELEMMRSENTATLIQQFAVGKPHFEEVRHTMGQLMQNQMAQTMDEAYEKALRLHPELNAQASQPNGQKVVDIDKARQAAQVAKSKAKQVKGNNAPSQKKTSETKQFDTTLEAAEAAWEKHMGSTTQNVI